MITNHNRAQGNSVYSPHILDEVGQVVGIRFNLCLIVYIASLPRRTDLVLQRRSGGLPLSLACPDGWPLASSLFRPALVRTASPPRRIDPDSCINLQTMRLYLNVSQYLPWMIPPRAACRFQYRHQCAKQFLVSFLMPSIPHQNPPLKRSANTRGTQTKIITVR